MCQACLQPLTLTHLQSGQGIRLRMQSHMGGHNWVAKLPQSLRNATAFNYFWLKQCPLWVISAHNDPSAFYPYSGHSADELARPFRCE